MLRSAFTSIAVSCIAVAVATVQQKPQAAPNDNRQLDGPAVHMTVRLIEKNGEVTKVLANPTICAIEGRPFAFMAGAEVEGTSPVLEYGTRIEGTVSTTKTKAFALAMKLTQGQLVNSSDPKTQAVRSLSVDMRTEIEPAVTRTIQIDDKTSIEFAIERTTK